jgi:hypothetical protein
MGSSGMEAASIDIISFGHGNRDTLHKDATIVVLSSAELAECTCPDLCDRDHDRD